MQSARESVINALLGSPTDGKVNFSPTTQFHKDLMFYVISSLMSIQNTAPVYIPAD